MVKYLSILSLVSEDNKAKFENLENEWKKYFNVNHIVDKPENILNYLDQHVDILFLDDTTFFKLEYYEKFRRENPLFSYVTIAKTPSENDVFNFKLLVDMIVYSDISHSYLKWSSIAALRRYWHNYSNQATIIYRNIIADFAENCFSINKSEIPLTKMESKLLRIFMTNIGKILSKNEIFKKVWGHEDEDISRNFDQMFFKLKTKIGKEYFEVKRNLGIVFR